MDQTEIRSSSAEYDAASSNGLETPQSYPVAHKRAVPKGNNLAYAVLGGLLVYVIARSLVAAAGKPLWFDELFTFMMTRQVTWTGIVGALRVPLDGHPPLFYLVERYSSALSTRQEIGLRLPLIFAFPVTLVCVFVYAKRRVGEIAAFLCALLLLLTNLFQYYAIEARPYSLVAACISFALLCYDRVTSSRWAILFALSLALAESFHYLAGVAMMPFALAELVILLKTRKFRWQVWGAFVAATIPLMLSWRLVTAFKDHYGSGLYSRFFKLSSIPRVYGDMFMTNRQLGFGLWGLVVAGIVVVYLRRRAERNDSSRDVEELANTVLFVSFVSLPFLAYFVLLHVAHSGFEERYIVCSVIGFVLSITYMLDSTKMRNLVLFGAFAICAVGVQEAHFWGLARGNAQDAKSIGPSLNKLFAKSNYRELPIVVPDGLALLPTIYYLNMNPQYRFVYVNEEHSRTDQNWEDTTDREYEELQKWWPVIVSDYAPFTATHRQFLIYVEEKDWTGDWLTSRLHRDGWTTQNVAADGFRRVYLATAGQDSSTSERVTPGRSKFLR